jgi:hypothetical protein
VEAAAVNQSHDEQQLEQNWLFKRRRKVASGGGSDTGCTEKMD